MKYFILIFSISFSISLYGQSKDSVAFKPNKRAAAKAQFICIWGDKNYMTLHTNEKIFIFKKGLEDGRYTAFFDKKYEDTAMTVTIENGKMNGVLKRWAYNDIDEVNNFKLIEIAQYENGLLNGYRKLFFYADDTMYTNIQFFDRAILISEPQLEW
tara:strand:+ start:5570 stop:6037 length:468 start_codon:yes stop_codon:yes gene_type:complete